MDLDKETTTFEVTRYGYLPSPMKVVFLTLVFAGLALTALYLFTGFSFMGERPMSDWGFYSLFIALFSACIFLIVPARKKDLVKLPWYDIASAAVIFIACIYMYIRSWDMTLFGWSSVPLGIIVLVFIMEGGRRSVGGIYLMVCVATV